MTGGRARLILAALLTVLSGAGAALFLAGGDTVGALLSGAVCGAAGLDLRRQRRARRAAEEAAGEASGETTGEAAEVVKPSLTGSDDGDAAPGPVWRLIQIRPTRRLLGLGLFAFALTVLIALQDGGTPGLIWILWGPLIGLAAIDAGLSRTGPLRAELDGARELFAGETERARLSLRRPDGAAVRAPARAVARLETPDGLRAPDLIAFEDGPEGAQAEIGLTAARRGVWRLRWAWLTIPGPLGLVERCPRIPIDAAIRVIPNIRLIRSGQIDVTVRSALYGVKENALVGDGSDFHQLREWKPGMDTRSIDWKRSAARRALVAKETRAERNHQVVLALDNGYTLREEIEGLPKIDHQITAALACAWAAVLGGDRIGLLAFDARPRLYLPPEPGRAAFTRLRAATADLAYRSVESNHTLAMAHLHRKLRRRSLIALFSDFSDATAAELLVENIAALNKAHVVVFVTLKNLTASRIAEAPPGDLDDVARAVSAAEMLRERRLVLERLARLGVWCVEAEPAQVTGRLISTYLEIKGREAI